MNRDGTVVQREPAAKEHRFGSGLTVRSISAAALKFQCFRRWDHQFRSPSLATDLMIDKSLGQTTLLF